MINIWQFQSNLIRRLLIWSFLSILTGALMQMTRDRFVRGVGTQFAAWGFINTLIAIFGERAAQKRASQLPDPLAPEVTYRESRNLRRILWVNSGLDVGYLVGGLALALIKGKNDPGWRGQGIGIIIQGGFLLIFDLVNAIRIRNID